MPMLWSTLLNLLVINFFFPIRKVHAELCLFCICRTNCFPSISPQHLASGTSVGGTVGAAIGGFIGGVLLTAAIGGTGAGAMLYRVKREMSVPAQ